MRLWWFPLIVACNGRCGRDDDNCEEADRRTWYADNDGDGHGDPLDVSSQCEQPDGAVTTGDDCDDADSSLWQSASLWPDDDGDGYGVASAVETCAGTPGYADQDGDCDDQDGASYPGAEPVCHDGIDQDCDALSDCALPMGAEDVAEVAFTRFYGETGSALGTAVAGLGDLNDDGLADLGLGAPAADPWGGAQVFFGPTGSIEDAGSADVYLTTQVTDADVDTIAMGRAVAAADITGDGVRDLIIGAGEGNRYVGGGSINILAGPLASEYVVNNGASALTIVAAGGDLLLTGLDYTGSESQDLFAGSGAALLFVGPITEGGDAEDLAQGGLYNDSRIDGDSFGEALALGDLNADGTLDLLAGAPRVRHETPEDAEESGDLGGAYIYTSTSDLRQSGEPSFECCEDLSIFGLADGALLGSAVAFAGDPNGDGYDDIYIGAPGAVDEDGAATGVVYYFDGAGLSALDSEAEIYANAATATYFGGDAGDEFGASLLTGLNIDDQATLVIGAPGHDDETGAVALWYEQPSASDTLYEADYRLSGTAAGDRLGATLANAGDTNGLGWDDLLIGAPGTSGGDGAGWLLVFDQL